MTRGFNLTIKHNQFTKRHRQKENHRIMQINKNELRADRRALVDRIRAIKAKLRAPWTQPMAEWQRALHACKHEATELSIVWAYARGRQHLPDAERCREVALRRGPQYAIEEAA